MVASDDKVRRWGGPRPVPYGAETYPIRSNGMMYGSTIKWGIITVWGGIQLGLEMLLLCIHLLYLWMYNVNACNNVTVIDVTKVRIRGCILLCYHYARASVHGAGTRMLSNTLKINSNFIELKHGILVEALCQFILKFTRRSLRIYIWTSWVIEYAISIVLNCMHANEKHNDLLTFPTILSLLNIFA